MTFRSRLLVGFAAATLVPLAVLALGVRRQITARITAQYERRVETLARVAREDLATEGASIANRLAAIRHTLADDLRFRLAAVHGASAERPYLLDWAEGAMRVTGLSMLQIQDEAGRILSSGHFRNEFDRLEPELPRLIAATVDGTALVRARAPDGPFLALVRADSMRIGGRRFTIIGGTTVDDRLLRRFERDGELALSLRTPHGGLGRDSAATGDASGPAVELPLEYIDRWGSDSAAIRPASVVITHSRADLDALRGEVQRWLVAALATAAIGALLLAAWLSARLSRPLAELATATARIDLERLDLDLDGAARRDDEIGVLARRLGAMTRRLRTGTSRLREAERRATIGDMARQVNHDIKNGLIPIRNVLRHLAQVQETRPQELAGVFSERHATLESSLGYLDTLARSYARLGPRLELRPVDANAVVREVARTASAAGTVAVHTRLAESLPAVRADPVLLRRIVDNLVSNAIDSLESRVDAVTLATTHVAGGAVRISVADKGRGMTSAELTRAFDDFYTTKAGGTGLGLSVVRRLVADLQGTLHVESEPGRGTTFTIDLPASP